MAKTYRYGKRKIARKNKTNRNRNRNRNLNRKTNKYRKNLLGGSFSETGSFFSYLINNAASVFTVPVPSTISFDPRVTNQFIYQK